MTPSDHQTHSHPSARTGRIARFFWLTLGVSALCCGAIGVVLPLLPTTPFVLLAAFAFSKSSPKLRLWLTDHRVFGPIIADWESHGAIAPRYKVLSSCVMATVLVASFVAGVSTHVLLIQALVMAIAATYVLSRPSYASR